MVQALITINAVAGSDDDLPINTLVQLNNTGNGGELTYAWTILYQPPGAADALSSAVIQNPTFTPRKEGTYLLQLIVNQGLGTEVTNQVIAGIRQLKTFKRVPAVGETVEANATTGWAEPAVNEQLRELDALKADPGQLVASVNYVGPLVGDIVYFRGTATLKAGLPGEEKIIQAVEALATSASQMAQPLGYIVSTVDGGALANGDLANIRTTGLITNVALAGVLGNSVYVSDTGVLSLTAGTNSRAVGVIVRASGGTIDVWFDGDGAAGTLTLQAAYDGGNTINIGVSPVAISDTVDSALLNLTNDTAGASAPQLQIEGKSLTRQGMLINLLQYGSAEAISIADNAATKLKIWVDGLRGRVAMLVKPDAPIAAGTSGYGVSVTGGSPSAGGGGTQKGGDITVRGGNSVATAGKAGDVSIMGGDLNGGTGVHGLVAIGPATTSDVQIGGGGGSGGVPFSIWQSTAAPAALTDAVRPYVINEAPINQPTFFAKDEGGRVWRLTGGVAIEVDNSNTPYSLLTTDVGLDISASASAITINLPDLADAWGMLPISVHIRSSAANNVTFARGDVGDSINGLAADLVIPAAAVGGEGLDFILAYTGSTWVIRSGLPRNNFASGAAPTLADNEADGYAPGSLWIWQNADISRAWIFVNDDSGDGYWWEIIGKPVTGTRDGFMLATDFDRWIGNELEMGKKSEVIFRDEFTQQFTAGWTAVVSGASASAVFVGSLTGKYGACRLYCGTTATGVAEISSPLSAFYTNRYSSFYFRTKLEVDALSNATDEYDLFPNYVATDGVSFTYDRNTSLNWLITKWVAGARSAETDSGIVVAAATLYDLTWVWTPAAGGTVTFYINGTSVGTHTGVAMSNKFLSPGRMVKSAGTASQFTYLDYTEAVGVLATPRV